MHHEAINSGIGQWGPSGVETQKVIQDYCIKWSANLEIRHGDETHLILESRLDGRRILIICVDDGPASWKATLAYLKPFIADADKRIKSGAVSSAILITRRRPAENSRDAQDNVMDDQERSWKLKINTLEEFLGKRMRAR